MDLKEEVRRRIAALMQSAYERGYRDGAQSALAEIENISAEDVAERLKETTGAAEAITETMASEERRPAARKKPKAQQQRKAKPARPAAKTATVEECVRRLFASKGEAWRNEILVAARAEDPKITSKDLHNGIRALTKRAEIRIDPEDRAHLLPAKALADQMAAS